MNFRKDDLLPWFFNYLEQNNLMEKTGSYDTIISDMKKIPEFVKYFEVISEKDKEMIETLDKRYKKRELDDKQYHQLKDNIENKYYQVTELYREFYLHQNFRKRLDTVRYIYCECLMVKKEKTNERVTLAIYFDAGVDGTIGNEILHEVKNESISEYIKDLSNNGILFSDATYYPGENYFQNFVDMENYVKNKLSLL